jgi:hypothetical protein
MREIKVQLCRLTRFERRIIDRGLHGTIHNQCDSVIARREPFQNVMAVGVCLNCRQQSASIVPFNPNIRAWNRMSAGILDDPFQQGVCGRCACEENHGRNETNPNRFDNHNKVKRECGNKHKIQLVKLDKASSRVI